MSLNASNLNLTVNAGETNVVGLISNLHGVNYNFNPTQFTDGTGASQAQKVITLNPTVTTNGTTYDLTAIAGGPNNANVNFGSLSLLVIENTSSTIRITVGAAASSIWEDWTTVTGSTYSIPPGGTFVYFNPTATGGTVDATHKQLKVITPSSTAVAKIIAFGRGS